MSKREEFRFNTEAEACAFIEGIEYVNGGVEVISHKRQPSGSWVVMVENEDAEDGEL